VTRPEPLPKNRAFRLRPRLPHPIPQLELREGEVLITVPDFAYNDRKIAIYCDGYQYHASAETLELDARKRNYLQEKGWAVLTFWGRTILRNPEACASQVVRVYRSRAEAKPAT